MAMIHDYIRKSARTAGLTAVLLAVVFAMPTQHLKAAGLGLIGIVYSICQRKHP
jgi:hypothetical protein